MPLESMSKETSICGRPARRRRDAGQLEVGQALVVGGHVALALQHVDVDVGLVVDGGAEDLRPPHRDGGVARDEPGEHPARGLHPQRQRRHVQQQHVLLVARSAPPPCSAAPTATTSSGLTAARGLLAEERRHLLLHQRHAGLAAHQDDVVDVLDLSSRRP